MLHILHIVNGDSSADVLQATKMPGDIQPWREALMAGPAPQGLSPQEWIATRARFLSQDSGQDLEYCTNALNEQDKVLTSYSRYDEVILWFEYDLFCQVNLLYLLNWFSRKKLARTTLSLICINSFPGMIGFRGLGQLSPPQMASLFDQRQPVSSEALRLAQQAWGAYCSPEPKELNRLVNADTSVLPFLKNALLAHLKRFPSLANGLGKVENTALDIIAGGINEFEALFCIFSELEPAFGLGDLQFWGSLKKMISCKEPLIEITGRDNQEKTLSFGDLPHAAFELTKFGERVWQGQADFIETNGVDEWLGGVRLADRQNHWRWNGQKKAVERFLQPE
ncbi:MAG TPA: RNA polymerase subunit sigma-24 [bacterium]